MKTKNLSLALSSLLLLSGCAIGPDYARPKMPVPKSFKNLDQEAREDSNLTAVNTRWWAAFGDEGLVKAVDAALAANFDIRAASAQVDVLLGQFDEAKSYLYPHINGSSSFKRQEVSGSTSDDLKNGVTSTYAASLNLASYEIDLFGKVRRSTEAARAMLLSAEYGRRTTSLLVAAAVATAYVTLSSLDAQIAIAKENLVCTEQIERLTKIRYESGSLRESDWLHAVANHEAAKEALSKLESLRIEQEATFNTLLGQNPQDLKVSPIFGLHIPSVSPGLPSQLLDRRPDIKAAEQQLIAANAKIGIAKAAYFPSISLTGMLGNQSSELDKLFSSPTRIWQFTPTLNLPLFTAGAIAGQVKQTEAGKKEALAQYQKAIISAFNDADKTIGQSYKAKEQYQFAIKRAEVMKKAFGQTKLQYSLGSIAYTDMLVVQQNYLAAQQEMVIAKQNALIATIGLFKALGGGWDEKSLPDLPDYLPAGR